jgi:hypothetical protein
MTDLSDVSPGDIITSARANLVNDYVEDGTHRVNTLSLEIVGTEIIDSDGYVKPIRIINPDSNGTLIYNSAGDTLIAKIDDDGNLGIKGRVYQID